MTPETAGCTACGHTEHRYWDRCRRDGCNCAYRPTETAPNPANRGRDGIYARWGDQFVIAKPEPFPSKVTWRTHLLRPIWWLISRVIR